MTVIPVLVEIDIEENDGALRSALFEKGWLAPEAARSLLNTLHETEKALGDVLLKAPVNPNAEKTIADLQVALHDSEVARATAVEHVKLREQVIADLNNEIDAIRKKGK